MADPAYITVTAPEGRQTPVNRRDGLELDGAQLCATSGWIIRVRYAGSSDIRRSIRRGDLIMCDMNGAPVASVDLAIAPNDLPGGRIAIPREPRDTGKAMP